VPRDWQTLIGGMSDVQKLVHLAGRLDDFEVDRIKGELLREGRQAYEAELTRQAKKAGCPGRVGRLTGGPALVELNRLFEEHAKGIVNTYNYDLAGAIIAIRAETPTANRHVYARRVQDWETKRAAWKDAQIQQYTTGKARAMAQSDFFRLNNIGGVAVLKPGAAVCPVCQGWIDRGEISVREATNNPPPYHHNCPHRFTIIPDRVPSDECRLLWMGE